MQLKDSSKAIQGEIMPEVAELQPPPDMNTLDECADAIKNIMCRQVRDFVEIGRLLKHASELCEYAEYHKFLEANDISKSTAYRYVRVFEKFKYNFSRVELLKPSVQFALSDPKVPDEIVVKTIARATKGIDVQLYDVQAMIAAEQEGNERVVTVEIDPDLYIEKIQESIKQMNLQTIRFEKVGDYDYDALKQSSQEVVRMINKLSKCNV